MAISVIYYCDFCGKNMGIDAAITKRREGFLDSHFCTKECKEKEAFRRFNYELEV